jgi:hypothetical protein
MAEVLVQPQLLELGQLLPTLSLCGGIVHPQMSCEIEERGRLAKRKKLRRHDYVKRMKHRECKRNKRSAQAVTAPEEQWGGRRLNPRRPIT